MAHVYTLAAAYASPPRIRGVVFIARTLLRSCTIHSIFGESCLIFCIIEMFPPRWLPEASFHFRCTLYNPGSSPVRHVSNQWGGSPTHNRSNTLRYSHCSVYPFVFVHSSARTLLDPQSIGITFVPRNCFANSPLFTVRALSTFTASSNILVNCCCKPLLLLYQVVYLN